MRVFRIFIIAVVLALLSISAASPRPMIQEPHILSSADIGPSPWKNVTNNTAPHPENGTTAILSEIHSLGVPLKFAYLPNLNSHLDLVNGFVTGPSYTTGPAPMGIADYGLYFANGTYKETTYYTQSFAGEVNFKNATAFYLANDAPYSFSIQLNAILTNVTLFGSSAYTFWTQNVAFYSSRTHQLTLIDNLWNFSNPDLRMSQNVLYSHGSRGKLEYPTFYYAVGPTFNVTFPFNVSLYLNSTVSASGNDEVFFNYTVSGNTPSGKNVSFSGSFDFIEFNSTLGTPTGFRSAPALYKVSGYGSVPGVGIPYDAEFDLGGPGGGSTTSFYNVTGTMTLRYKSGGTYHNVPEAFNAGSETGETGQGVSVVYNTSGTALLSPGPSLISPLWNASQKESHGYSTLSGVLSPSNGYIFINSGLTPDDSTAAWSPVSTSGQFSYNLSPGNYTIQALMAFHNPVIVNVSVSSHTIKHIFLNMSFNPGLGQYTPLEAFDKAQLDNLTLFNASGNISAPLIISSYSDSLLSIGGKEYYIPQTGISSLFGVLNDYGFPGFPELEILNSNRFVAVENLSQPPVYFSPQYTPIASSLATPLTDQLGLWIYNDSNLSLVHNTGISGWYPDSMSSIPAADLIIWNSTNILVAGNTFQSQSVSVLVYNSPREDSNVTIWGNHFEQVPYFVYSQYASRILDGLSPVGVELFSSHNIVYNNYFSVAVTAVSSGKNATDPYTGSTVNYTDQWNISRSPDSIARSVNGHILYGNIIGLGYQGGNFWWNYFGNGTSAYNNTINGTSLIQSGKDELPLVPKLFKVSIEESGLPVGTSWEAGVINLQQAIDIGPLADAIGLNISKGNTSTLTFQIPNGTYEFQVPQTIISPDYSFESVANNSSGIFSVAGSDVVINIDYTTSLLYNVTLGEIGLPLGAQWGFTISNYSIPEPGLTLYFNESVISSSASITLVGVPEDSTLLLFMIGSPGYSPTPPVLVVHVSNSSLFYLIRFTPTLTNLTLGFIEEGLPAGTSWSVTLGNETLKSTNSSIYFGELTSGFYRFTVGAVGGFESVKSGVIDLSGNFTVVIQFVPTVNSMTYVFLGIGIAGGAVAGFVASAVYKRGRT